MEKEIEDLKNIYLSTTPPMKEVEGFSDILMRLDNYKEKPVFRYSYLYIGIALVILVALSSLIFVTDNSVSQAIKNRSHNLYNSVFQPTITPASSPNLNILEKKPTPTPTKTTQTSENEKSYEDQKSQKEDTPGFFISNYKKENNPTEKDTDIKGVSNNNSNNHSDSSDLHESNNSEDHENSTNNSSKNDSNKSNDHSSEKSNQKEKD